MIYGSDTSADTAIPISYSCTSTGHEWGVGESCDEISRLIKDMGVEGMGNWFDMEPRNIFRIYFQNVKKYFWVATRLFWTRKMCEVVSDRSKVTYYPCLYQRSKRPWMNGIPRN